MVLLVAFLLAALVPVADEVVATVLLACKVDPLLLTVQVHVQVCASAATVLFSPLTEVLPLSWTATADELVEP